MAAARRALGCEPLAGYLRAITSPMTVSRFVSDLGASFGYTTMSFSAYPTRAAVQLCGPTATAHPAGSR